MPRASRRRGKEATTRSPRFTVVTSVPLSSTMPMNSWPMRAGPSSGFIEP
ncbi:hypothetical protein OG916_01995 [Streptomyces sp. NBC_01767]|nr:MULTISPECIES: hypothetical protein [unclassified Streptomyces]MCX4391676.1 hypothetical protein [Streptomyces sp. NBC_01767]MCX5103319.1 hypothetical protein [Streptomyces sp. NBC_00439]MCX5546204.1 hypothetical protein [Streptomyces sp. NBC_00051]WSP44632.1 hypothetical protein OG348_01555 [Streptomyces sp. NBC_01243]